MEDLDYTDAEKVKRDLLEEGYIRVNVVNDNVVNASLESDQIGNFGTPEYPFWYTTNIQKLHDGYLNITFSYIR